MKSIRAYAIVNKNKPQLKVLDIYDEINVKNICLDKDEKIIIVNIKALDERYKDKKWA